MKNKEIIIGLFIVCALLSLSVQNIGAFIALSLTICLYGFEIFLTKRDESKLEILTAKVKSLEERVSMIQAFGGKRGN